MLYFGNNQGSTGVVMQWLRPLYEEALLKWQVFILFMNCVICPTNQITLGFDIQSDVSTVQIGQS